MRMTISLLVNIIRGLFIFRIPEGVLPGHTQFCFDGHCHRLRIAHRDNGAIAPVQQDIVDSCPVIGTHDPQTGIERLDQEGGQALPVNRSPGIAGAPPPETHPRNSSAGYRSRTPPPARPRRGSGPPVPPHRISDWRAGTQSAVAPGRAPSWLGQAATERITDPQ